MELNCLSLVWVCGVTGCFGLFLLIIYEDLEWSRYFVGFMVVLRWLRWEFGKNLGCWDMWFLLDLRDFIEVCVEVILEVWGGARWWWEIWRWEVEIFELRCGWNWYALLAKRTLVLKCKLRPVRTQKPLIDNINKGQIVSFWHSTNMLYYVVIDTILCGCCLFFCDMAQ